MKEPPWGRKERDCIFLLQRPNSKLSLLQIYAFILRHALETNAYLLTKFITTCSETINGFSNPLSGIQCARHVFDQRRIQDDFLCNSMIRAHVQQHQLRESMTLYDSLRAEGTFSPDNYTFPFLFKCCASNLAACEGKQIHDHVIKIGYESNLYVSSSMVDMYSKWGDLNVARKLFDEMSERNQVAWTAIIVGYARYGDLVTSKELFDAMPHKDIASFNAMIDALAKIGDMTHARELFVKMPKRNVVTWTSLMLGYCKNSRLDEARLLFDEMPEKSLFSWNVMIGGYSQNRQPHEALALFQELQSNSTLQPDHVTLVSIIPAIADLGALELGFWIHSYVKRMRFDQDISILTALVDMYAKCGDVSRSKQLFDIIHPREVATWNAMINGFAINGMAEEAIKLFEDMKRKGYKPNKVTMIGVLSACSHGGLVDEGKRLFSDMENHGIAHEIEHLGCMVDLLGRAGLLDEAEDLMEKMSLTGNSVALSSLMFACGAHGDVNKANRLMKKAMENEPLNVGNYVIMRNLYAGKRSWSEVEKFREMMRRTRGRKEVGCSVIEVNNRVWEFVAGDVVHPNSESLYEALRNLWLHMNNETF